MLVQRCTLDQHRLIVPVSMSKPIYSDGGFAGSFTQNTYVGLIDTGAQRTVVTRSVIAELDLMRTGHMQFKGIHEPRTHTRYLVAFGLWGRRITQRSSPIDYDQAEQSLFSIAEPIEIVNMDDNANFDVILGFDILKNFDFSYNQRTRTFELQISR